MSGNEMSTLTHKNLSLLHSVSGEMCIFKTDFFRETTIIKKKKKRLGSIFFCKVTLQVLYLVLIFLHHTSLSAL